jgi:hypothetical protein
MKYFFTVGLRFRFTMRHNVLQLGVCYFGLQIFQVYHKFNSQNYSTKPLLVAGAVKLNENGKITLVHEQ